MDISDRTLLEKLLGMLGSDQMGERASAGAFIHRMAVKYKKTIPELMKAAYAGGAAPPQQPGANPYYNSPFDDLRADLRRQQQRYDEARRAAAMQEEQRRRAAARAQEEERLRAARERHRAREQAAGSDDAARPNELLRALREAALMGILTAWEQQFAEDVSRRYERDDQLSDKQRSIVEKIIRKTTFARTRRA